MDERQPENKDCFPRKIFVMLSGLSVTAVGVAMSKKASIGTTPISCIPATLTDCLPDLGLTLGNWTIVFNLLLLVVEIIILGRSFHLIQILQLGLVVFLGYMIDFAMDWLLFWMTADTYFVQWLFCILSCVVLGLGVMMQVRANLLVVPGDALVIILAGKIKTLPFHKIKILVDAAMAVTACIISLWAVGELTGAREGTVFAALAVGTFVGIYRARLGKYIDAFIGIPEKNEYARITRNRNRQESRGAADNRCFRCECLRRKR